MSSKWWEWHSPCHVPSEPVTYGMWGQGWDLCQGWGTSTKGRLVSPLLTIHLMEEVTQNTSCGRGSPI